MTVTDFLIKFEADKENAVNIIIKDGFKLGFVEKMSEAQRIAKICTTTPSGKFMVNSINQSFFYILSLLQNYTKLQLQNDDLVNEYDELDRADAIGLIVDRIDERERNELMTMVKLAFDDEITNRTNIPSYIDEVIDKKITPLLSALQQLSNTELKNTDVTLS